MNSVFETLLGISVTVERTTEIIKSIYRPIRNTLFKKPKEEEITKIEKEAISFLAGVGTCASIGFGVDIPGVNEGVFVQFMIAGAISGLGSNVIHAIISILVAIKNNIEEAKKALPKEE